LRAENGIPETKAAQRIMDQNKFGEQIQACVGWYTRVRTASAFGEFLGPRPRHFPQVRISRSGTDESETADQQAPIIIEPVRRAGDTIDEIEAPLDRRLGTLDLVLCVVHWQG